MISAEQLEARTRALGGSDAAILLGLPNPGNRTLLDLWASKRRGQDLELAPIQPPEPPEDSATYWGQLYANKLDPRDVGNEFEQAVVRLYENQTGLRTRELDTQIHPEHAWAQANPDRGVYFPERRELEGTAGPDGVQLHPKVEHGLECKLVGRWATGPWEGDVLPEYVLAQVQFCMAVTGLERWDVAAWIAGTEVRVVPVQRDPVVCEALLELGRDFWEKHILGNEPPEPLDADDLLRFCARRHPKDNGHIVKHEDDPELGAQVMALTERYDRLREAGKRITEAQKEVTAKLVALTGENLGVSGPWGYFKYPTRAGNVSWKKVAMVLGTPPDELVEEMRGAPFRVTSVYIAKDRRPWRK